MTEKKGFIGKIAEDLAESAHKVHKINKENIKAVHDDTKANIAAATTPDPDFVKFKQAKGLRNKAKVVVENIKESARGNSAQEKERRAEIRSHESYRMLLEEQRAARQATIKGLK